MMATQQAERKQGSGLEKNGVAIAVALHVVVIALLSIQWTAGSRRFDNPPMEVDLIAETAATSTAPEISELPPAARLGEEYAPDIASSEATPAPPTPEPITRPNLAPAPKPVERATPAPPKTQPPAATEQPKASPKPTPKPQDKPTRPTGRLDHIAEGLSRTQPKESADKGAPAAATAAEVKRSIDVSIKAAVAPPWNRCRVSGLDVDQLVTTVKFRLSQAGGLVSFSSVTTSGVNDSNQAQVAIHQECAKKAIQLASPFDLDPDNYEYWKEYTLHFNKK